MDTQVCIGSRRDRQMEISQLTVQLCLQTFICTACAAWRNRRSTHGNDAIHGHDAPKRDGGRTSDHDDGRSAAHDGRTPSHEHDGRTTANEHDGRTAHGHDGRTACMSARSRHTIAIPHKIQNKQLVCSGFDSFFLLWDLAGSGQFKFIHSL